jgi:Tol biopolymer transport system component
LSLAAGSRIGPYEILAPVGAGGMGEVYKGRDTRLDRIVAIKVLPAALAKDPHFRDRFEREARAISALDHPRICALYDVGVDDGTAYLVMPFLDGETLAQRMTRGPLPVDESLRFAMEIAEALEAAHARGIVHRDLKPANIKVIGDGSIKVLDFGLAKEVVPSATSLSLSPTFTAGATQAGMILGTAAYMSPEQARGETVDERADIWAFGCVWYEMLTAQQVFGGPTLTDTLAAIVRGDPDWSRLPPGVPSGVVRMLRRCLAKDVRNRFRNIADVRIGILDMPADMPSAEPVTMRSRRPIMVAAAVVGAVLGAAAATALLRRGSEPPSQIVSGRPIRLTMPLADGERLGGAQDAPLGVGRPSIAISRNGRMVAYVAVRDAVSRLYVRPMDQGTARVLGGTEGASSPFFSPDGQWVAFFADTKLKKVSLLGGDPIVVCDARNPMGGSWGDDNDIVFGNAEASRLARVAATGGTVRTVSPAGQPYTYTWPDLLPDGKNVLVTRDAGKFGGEAWRLSVVSLETGQTRDLVDGLGGRYLDPGFIVFVRGTTLMAATFDPSRGVGTPVPLVNEQRRDTFGAQFALSREGSLVYATGTESVTSNFVWVDRRGKATALPDLAPRTYGTFRISPEGGRLAVQTTGGTADVWTFDFDRAAFARLTTSANNAFPSWTHDGRGLTFASDRSGTLMMLSQPADGSRDAQVLAGSEGATPEEWSPDGRILAFDRFGAETGTDLWLLPMDGDRLPRAFLQTPYEEWGLRFSPDGRWVAYVSDESGRYEVYVRPFPGPGGKYQISSEGGEEPVWHPNGRELIFRNGQKWMGVAVGTEAGFSAQTPQKIFEGPYINVAGFSYDIAHDGSRFLVLKGQEQPPVSSLNIVIDWIDEVRRRVR